MPRPLLDTSVLFAAAYRRDSAHDDALPILRGIDDGSLPEGVVLDYVLAETLNGLTTHAGHDLEANAISVGSTVASFGHCGAMWPATVDHHVDSMCFEIRF